jgi:hypothetical protein
MGAHRRLTYATKAKMEHAVRMAEIAGISEIGGFELAPDGTIRIFAKAHAAAAPSTPEDEVAEWRAKRGRK